MVFIFLFGAALAGKLFLLQVVKHDFYSALALGLQKNSPSRVIERGEIFFQNHNLPIAANKTVIYLYASPKEIPFNQKEPIAQKLSELVNLDKDFILEKLKQDTLYQRLKDDLTSEELDKLEKLKLEGVYLRQELRRNYPYEEFAAHLLGFVNKDGQGQYGVEGYWDEVLKTGEDLHLTIDYNIQYQAEKLLKEAAGRLKIEGGTIIVMQPDSGRLLALANWPSFDPNRYWEEDLEVFQLDAIQKIFEPGSIFKPLTLAGALDLGKITPQTTYLDKGYVKIEGWPEPLYNYDKRVYGEQTMTNVLEKSINTGAVFAEQQLGHINFLEYIKKFGIFEKTEIDLEGEVYSSNQDFKRGYEINFATAAYGQGIEMTPMQIARAFSAIANGGKLVRPYLAERLETKPQISDNKVISQSTASKLTAMLVSVVENGFGKAAQIPGYYVAGKTGTAQMSFSALGLGQRGYSEKTWQSFVGFVPAFDPEFLILVKLNDPATRTAEYSAVPVFQKLAKYIIDYYKIPPDYEVSK